MVKRVKPPVRFTASLPMLLSEEYHHAQISKKLWDTLPPDKRSYDLRTYESKDDPNGTNRTIYQQIVHVPPFPNPYVKALHKKLQSRRIKYVTAPSMVDGVEFINFSTLE